MPFKKEVERLIVELQTEAVKEEGINSKALDKLGVAKDIIADQQYWSGYLDALNNMSKGVKKIRK